MNLTSKELWGLIHGMVLGGMFLLTFAGGLAGLYGLRPEWVTVTGLQERMRRLDIGTILMAVVAWLTCITGTFIVYTWYRAAPPQGTEGDALRGVPGATSCWQMRGSRRGTTSEWSGRSTWPGLLHCLLLPSPILSGGTAASWRATLPCAQLRFGCSCWLLPRQPLPV